MYDRAWTKGEYADAILRLEEERAADPDWIFQQNMKRLGVCSILVVGGIVIATLVAAGVF